MNILVIIFSSIVNKDNLIYLNLIYKYICLVGYFVVICKTIHENIQINLHIFETENYPSLCINRYTQHF
jgi:hypothetical protein